MAGLLTGWVFDFPLLFLSIAVAVYLLWQVRHLYRFEHWLREGAPEESNTLRDGVWSTLYYHLSRLQRRNQKNKRRLSAYANRVREMHSALPDGVVVLEQQGEIDWFNDMAARLLGLRAPQDRGQRIDNLLRDPRFIEYYRRGDYRDPLEMPSTVNAELHLLLRIVSYGEGQRLLIVRDISRLHRLEQVRRDFVANVSHELRTPLTVLRGYMETLQDQSDGKTPEAPLLRQMYQQTERMQGIVEDLLLLSRLESRQEPPGAEVDVPALLKRIMQEAQSLSGGRHELVLHDAEGLRLRGSEKELHSAFLNLVTNAVRYTPEGGRIELRWERDGSSVLFRVKDSGIGIPEQHIPRLTERFYRVDAGRSRQAGGTGLGLAIVKHVLERHHATLEIESAPGKGSEFRCRFPAESIVAPANT